MIDGTDHVAHANDQHPKTVNGVHIVNDPVNGAVVATMIVVAAIVIIVHVAVIVHNPVQVQLLIVTTTAKGKFAYTNRQLDHFNEMFHNLINSMCSALDRIVQEINHLMHPVIQVTIQNVIMKNVTIDLHAIETAEKTENIADIKKHNKK